MAFENLSYTVQTGMDIGSLRASVKLCALLMTAVSWGVGEGERRVLEEVCGAVEAGELELVAVEYALTELTETDRVGKRTCQI